MNRSSLLPSPVHDAALGHDDSTAIMTTQEPCSSVSQSSSSLNVDPRKRNTDHVDHVVKKVSEQQPPVSPPGRVNRSVLDFDSVQSLRAALKDCCIRSSSHSSLRPMSGEGEDGEEEEEEEDDDTEASDGSGSSTTEEDWKEAVLGRCGESKPTSGIYEEEELSSCGSESNRSLHSSTRSMNSSHTKEGGAGEQDAAASTGGKDLDWVVDHLDAKTCKRPNPREELRRLQVLRSYDILDVEREQCFERITALASRIYRVPVAIVSLVDLGRQFLMSNRGLPEDVREIPRKIGICAHTIMTTEDVLIVPDTTKDARFRDSPLVKGPPHIRFYAGAPLHCPEGYRLGALCIVDMEPRPKGLSYTEKQNLREMASLVVDHMVSRRRDRRDLSRHRAELMACTAHDLLPPLSAVRSSLEALSRDTKMMSTLDEHQRELLQTAGSCSDVVNRICQRTIESFRHDRKRKTKRVCGAGGGERGAEDNDDDDDDVSDGEGNIMEEIENGLQSRAVLSDGDDATIQRGSQDKTVAGATMEDKKTQRATDRRTEGDGACSFFLATTSEDKTSTRRLDDDGDDFDANGGHRIIVLSDLVESLRQVMIPYPKRVPVTITLESAVPDQIVCDDLKLFRSAQNYLTNSCTHTFTGSIHMRIYAVGGAAANDDNKKKKQGELVFQCEDTGPGIPHDQFTSLFLPPTTGGGGRGGRRCDQMVHDGKQGQGQGHGMGLFSVASNISSVGGSFGYFPREAKVASRSEGGDSAKGSIFWFSVPLVEPPKGYGSIAIPRCLTSPNADVLWTANPQDGKMLESFAGPTIVLEPSPPSLTPGTSTSNPAQRVSLEPASSTDSRKVGARVRKALVIDDTLVIRKTIDRALSKMGYQVTQATNGMEGLNKLRSNLYDLTLCDFLMPVMDGIDCVRQYRNWENARQLPGGFRHVIVGISAHADPGDIQQGLDVGMNKFLPKPVSLRSLKELPDMVDVKEASSILDELWANNNLQRRPGDQDHHSPHLGVTATAPSSPVAARAPLSDKDCPPPKCSKAA